MKEIIIVRNSELDEPYCFVGLENPDDPGSWFGVGEYHPERIIPGWVALVRREDGREEVYWVRGFRKDGSPTIVFSNPPLDNNQSWEDWARMLNDPNRYPSASHRQP